MATTREIEIGENLRKKGYSDNQIVAAIKYRREKERVEAINRKNDEKRAEYLKEQESRNDVSVADEFWDTYQDGKFNREDFRLNEDGAVEKRIEEGWELVPTKVLGMKIPSHDNIYNALTSEAEQSKYRPILNEETQLYEWHSVKDGETEKVDDDSKIKKLDLQNPNAANEHKDSKFKVKDGKWHKVGEDGNLIEILESTELSLINDLDRLHEDARTVKDTKYIIPSGAREIVIPDNAEVIDRGSYVAALWTNSEGEKIVARRGGDGKWYEPNVELKSIVDYGDPKLVYTHDRDKKTKKRR